MGYVCYTYHNLLHTFLGCVAVSWQYHWVGRVEGKGLLHHTEQTVCVCVCVCMMDAGSIRNSCLTRISL